MLHLIKVQKFVFSVFFFVFFFFKGKVTRDDQYRI